MTTTPDPSRLDKPSAAQTAAGGANAGPTLAKTDFAGDVQAATLGGALRDYVDRIRGGDVGALPAVAGLVVLGLLFFVLQPDVFLSVQNIANLLVQAGSICVLGMALIPVLLLGDIDLSAGVAGGAAAGVMAILVNKGLAWPIGVLGALVTGLAIGVIIGVLVGRLGIPSFVVTLAFFIGLQGVTLRLIGEGGTVPVRNAVLIGIANSNLPPAVGWVVAIVVAVLFAVLTLNRYRQQVAKRLQHPPLALVVVRVVGVAVILVAIAAILNVNRARVPNFFVGGIPYTVPIVGVLLVAWTFVLGRTRYGRHVYAVGGNREAARRAGIPINAIRISVFTICSAMAAISGILDASRLNSVTPSSGAGNTLLYAVGAAVIGGTSLFGGRGKMRDAIIGGLVIAVINNGLSLMNLKSYVNFLVTGVVLLLAAAVDAISRRRRNASGI